MKKSNIGRLEEVLNQVEDEKLRDVIRGVFRVEISYRSTERVNFPWQKIRDIIEGVARSTQLNLGDKQKEDEVSKN
ncbi:hypothetical protein Belba_0954 [Belliella baltica DSM 15883]|uniref:Uncharacterized protein n=1 Tax=Belliella baltica (strain DSM 15883 / CIP 108006 / LMG 21964 / BA134) TaxID=866536 RepID=I3Z2X9_BELBD|nr:hypothetical protein [Belliella baltica]AFL83597.1 hypothetical protein Belba_0954 [Belliella baltica DSM 15883]